MSEDEAAKARQEIGSIDELRRHFDRARLDLAKEIQHSRMLMAQIADTLAYADAMLARVRGMQQLPRVDVRRRVLIVDDNIDSAHVLHRGLTDYGHIAEITFTPSSALVLARYFEPEVVLVDISLPDIDGWELGRQLHAQRPAHMIAMTGFTQLNDRQRSLDAGFAEHLLKPLDLRQLARMVVAAAA